MDKMLEEGQIEHSVSAWSVPTVLVTKKDGTTRFCVDYRRLNARTKKDAFPLPRIDDSLNSLSGQAWFSTLDLASGYWQVRFSEDAKPKTAFATHSGLFQFAVMPFGLCNTPATFERLMSQVMRGLHWKRCLVYIDDILVFGNDFESALHSLELVLIRVAEYGLQLKSTKCNLFRASVPFLGHIVGRAGLECDPNKSAVANWIPPSTIKRVREILGFTGYYRRFVPDYSTVAQPLVRLLGKDCKFKWTDACQDAFKALRALLIKAPVLAFPKEDLPYIVDTDASDYGIGGVLSHCIEGTEHVIAYYSKSLVVCDYFTKYTEAYPLKDKTARSVADALMDIWLPRYGFPMFLHSDQGKEFDNTMIHKLSELLGTVKTKTTPYHPRSDGLVERFNRTLLAMLAMFVSREHDNWDDLLPFMMLAYNTTVHTTTGFTSYRLVFGEESNLPGNLVHRELRPDPPSGDPGTYASWVQQALHESYDEVRAQQQRATHRQKRNYDSKVVARAFPIGCWMLRYYPPARKNKLCSPWIGPYKIVRTPMER